MFARTWRIALVLSVALALVPVAPLPAIAAAGEITRVSVSSAGGQSAGYSFSCAISADGRYVAFRSYAANLVDDDTNNATDIFVHDRETGETTRVSVDSLGAQGDGDSYAPSISGDGRYVAFTSYATNLASGDSNAATDVFVHDLQTGATTSVSVDALGTQANSYSYYPSISTDGRYVAFASSATNLVPDDTNSATDIFVRDRQAGSTTRVSVDSSGAQINDNSSSASISADGRRVAFTSNAPSVVPGDTNSSADVFVHDLESDETTRASVDSAGNQGDAEAGHPSISADGRYVTFSTYSALVPEDVNGSEDVYVRDSVGGTTTCESLDYLGAPATGYYPSISGDGRYVAFQTKANLLGGDYDANSANDIYLRDRVTGVATGVGVIYEMATSAYPAISADGRYVAFESEKGSLVANDTNGLNDIFVYDRGPEDTTAPDTTATVDPASNASGWNNSATLVSLEATDGPSGSGVAGTDYVLDGAAAQPYTEAVAVIGEGTHTLAYSSVDVAGNRETTTTATIKIDTTDPVTTSDAQSSYTGSAVISLNATDTLSGVAMTQYRVDGGTWKTGTAVTVATSGAHTLEYRSTDVADNVEAIKSAAFTIAAPVAPKSSTAIALTSKSNSSLGYGKTFTIKGTLKSGSTGLSGKQVILQAAAPGKAFTDTSYKTTTTSGGAFTFYVKPSAKTSYKVRFAADSAYSASASTYVYAKPKVSLGTPTAPKTMKKSKSYTVYGSLKPKHTAGTKPVRIYKYKKVGKKWVKKGYVTAKAYTYKSYTRYKVKVKLTSKGTWRLRAYAPADSLHAATWSAKYDTVKVK